MDVYGKGYVRVADCHNSIGMILQELGEHEEAKQAYREALIMYAVRHGRDHPSIAKVTNNLGSLFDDMGEKASAKVFYEQSIKIMEKHRISNSSSSSISENDSILIASLDNLSAILLQEASNSAYKEGLERDQQIHAILNSKCPSNISSNSNEINKGACAIM